MGMISMVVGATTDGGATFVAKVDTGPVRIAVSTSANMSSPTFFGPESVDAQGVARVAATGLVAATRYWWQVEDNSVLDTGTTGQLRTHPTEGEPASFTVAMASCSGATPEFPGVAGGELDADAVSNSPVYDTIRGHEPLMFFNLGDWGYSDFSTKLTESVANRRTFFDDLLAQPRQAQFHREIPFTYAWDDHDFAHNDSDGTYADKANAAQVYRERIPHYTLDDAAGIWQEWTIGRVQFVMFDSRYYRDPNSDPQGASKTMLGTDQKTWLENLLDTSTAEFLVVLSPSVWFNTVTDSWGSFTDERDELAGLFNTYGWSDRMVMVYGDRHGIGIDSGASNPSGSFPVMNAAALDDSTISASTAGRYDVLDDTAGTGQYGTVTVTDLGSVIAVRLAAWREDSQEGSFTVVVDTSTPEQVSFPDIPLDITVEIFVDGMWIDVTSDVRGHPEFIEIKHGRSGEASSNEPSRCTMTINNRGGTYSPRNPLSPYFGKIGRNTPLRVKVGIDIRFAGEVPAWPQRWDKSGNDVWVPLVASGISRRIGQGSTPVRSSLATEIPAQLDTGLLHAYWPCEDGPAATQIAPGIPGVEPLAIGGDVETAAADAPIPATDALLQLNDGLLRAPVPGTGHRCVFYLEVPSTGLTDSGLLCRLSMHGGTMARADMRYLSSDGGNLEITLVDDADNTDVHSPLSASSPELDGGLWIISLSLFVPGGTSNTFAAGSVRPVASDGTIGDRDSIGAAVLAGEPGDIAQVRFGGDLGGGVFGHPAITSSGEADFPYNEEGTSTAYLAEPAGDRVERLCEQENIAVAVTGIAGDTQAMGPQTINTLLTLLRECADTDGGILGDDPAQLGLRYRTLASLYQQDPAIELDYTDGVFASIPEPVDDDNLTRNDVTASRPGGSSARAVQETGPLSVQDPPDGVGRYDTSVQVSVPGDGFLTNQAGWRLHLGTAEGQRFPKIELHLHNPVFADDLALTLDAENLRLGDLITLTNLPDWVSIDPVSLIVRGIKERLSNFLRFIEISATPAEPYQIAEVEHDEFSFIGSDGSTVESGFDAGTDTSLSVAVADGYPLWDDRDAPFDIIAGGVRLTVTAITGASSPQTFTVDQAPVNGVEKTIPAGSTVDLFHKSYIGV